MTTADRSIAGTRPPCVVFVSAFNPRRRIDAAHGGPGGELLMANSLVQGLQALDVRVVAIGSLRRFAAHRLVMTNRRRTRYFLDPWTLELACRYRLLRAPDGPRIRVLEWFGTPPTRVSRALPNLAAAQYLTPHRDDRGWNRFLGYFLSNELGNPLRDAEALRRSALAALSGKKRQGIVWGKDARYFGDEARRVIEALAPDVELHVTISPERGYRTELLPPSVINHGALAPSAWRMLLRESSFVLGLGDPVLGPTALEAIAAGCTYLNPRFAAPRALNDCADLTIGSQHPFAAAMGPPFVRDIDLRDPAAVRRSALDALNPGERQASLDGANALAHLAPFTQRAYLARLRALLEDDLDGAATVLTPPARTADSGAG